MIDGEVISQCLTPSASSSAKDRLTSELNIMSGQIVKIYAIDAPGNNPKGKGVFTVYDVVVKRPGGCAETIWQCRSIRPLWAGSWNDYSEVLLGDPGQDINDPTKDPEFKKGTMVAVCCLEGRKTDGLILGAMPHPNAVAQARRPSKSKGKTLVQGFNGLEWSISSAGALLLTFNGPRNDSGAIAGSNGPTSIEIDASGNIKVSTNAAQSVSIDRTSKKIVVTNGPTSITSDANGDKISVVAKIVEIGKGDLQPAVVGNDWKKIMEQLIEAITQLTVPTGVGPSGTPINSAAFIKVKNQLKEALSKNHKVEK